ncbi:MAG: 3-hydroxyacyl-CoA dehydrogenase NAD-binding domain-containing protein [Sphingomonadales bacterium]|jgi:3-hydroxyacyl-CoA dehydrogenase
MQGSFEKRGPIGIIWVDHPPVNAISQGVRQAIIAGVEQGLADDDVKAMVLACKGRTFMAGADISEFGQGPKDPQLAQVITTLENSTKIIVAAMFGTAFGGGLEVSLACNYRIALPTTRIGLPEVKLGIIPGAGGTQRLPRAAGVEFALPAIVSGDPIPAPAAEKAGAIDAIVEGDIVDCAVGYAQDLLAQGAPLKKVRDIKLDAATYHQGYFDGFRKSIARKARGFHAPERAIQAVEAAVNLDFDDGVKRERELIMECFRDPQSKALQHVFFAEREATKIPGLAKDIELRPIRKVGIIGAGTMGGGIAMNFANAGIAVTMLELNQEALDKGLGIIRRNYENTAKKGRLTMEKVEERMSLLTPTTSYADLGDVDLVIEAVFENMDVKKTVFTELNKVTRPDAILATNTSYLNIDEIAAVVSNSERVLGMHFFSPANVMRLLEIVRAEKTAPDVLATVLKLAKTIRKVGVVAGVCHGFIGNRMLSGYAREANLLVLEGATPQQVDKALFDFGMPMGVLAMGDLAGLDIGYRLREQLDESQYDVRSTYVADKLVEMGRLGQKTGAGIYDYEPGNRTPIPSDITAKLIEEAAAHFGIERREVTTEEIITRCFAAMVNIGCDILDEGMAYRASDIDITYINGYGFPAYRGGPMYWAEHDLGLENLLNHIKAYAEQYGDRWWKPSPLLERLVREGKGFRDL